MKTLLIGIAGLVSVMWLTAIIGSAILYVAAGVVTLSIPYLIWLYFKEEDNEAGM